ncbi:MAG: DUF1272 domain-containing protein [Flavobacteriaceae bacterium]
MLEIRPSCENCNKLLANDVDDAMICTFECTFCSECVETILHSICPNCGGNFSKRPKRPETLLEKYPVSTKIVHKPVDVKAHLKRIEKL